MEKTQVYNLFQAPVEQNQNSPMETTLFLPFFFFSLFVMGKDFKTLTSEAFVPWSKYLQCGYKTRLTVNYIKVVKNKDLTIFVTAIKLSYMNTLVDS